MGFPFDTYIIWDRKNNLFWEKNLSYGYNYQNQAVFEARFSNDITEATMMSRPKAYEVLDRFKKEPHIVGGRYKEADTTDLVVADRCSFISKEDYEKFFK